MTTLERELDKLIQGYEQDVQDYRDHIDYDQDEHQYHYEGRLQQLELVIEDLKWLKNIANENQIKKTR